MLGKSFNIYKPQVQGASLTTRGVVCRELGFQAPELTKASQARQNRRDKTRTQLLKQKQRLRI